MNGAEVIMICLRTVKYLFPWCIYAFTVLKGLTLYQNLFDDSQLDDSKVFAHNSEVISCNL